MLSFIGSSKKDIYDAYKALLEQQGGEVSTLSTTEVAKRKAVASAIEFSNTVDTTALQETVSAIHEKINEFKKQYDDLNLALTAKRKEIKDVHGIEAEANSLFALQEVKSRLLSESEAKVAEANEEADSIIKSAMIKCDKLFVDAENAHARTEEEYAYTTTRRREKEEDAFNDKLQGKLKVLQQSEADLVARSKILAEKEKEVAIAMKEFDAYKLTVSQTIETEVAKAVEKATEKFNSDTKMMANKYTADIRILEERNISLTEKVSDLEGRLTDAYALVKDANSNITSMAKDALKSDVDEGTVKKIAEMMASSGTKVK
jgi:hypothetical protein